MVEESPLQGCDRSRHGHADIDTVRRLNELIDSEVVIRKDAEARADEFARERNKRAAAVGVPGSVGDCLAAGQPAGVGAEPRTGHGMHHNGG